MKSVLLIVAVVLVSIVHGCTDPPTPAPTPAPTTPPSGCTAWNGASIASGSKIALYSNYLGKWMTPATMPGPGVGVLSFATATQSTATQFTLGTVSAFQSGQQAPISYSGTTYCSSWGGNFLTPGTSCSWNFAIVVDTAAPYVRIWASQKNGNTIWSMWTNSMNNVYALDYDYSAYGTQYAVPPSGSKSFTLYTCI